MFSLLQEGPVVSQSERVYTVEVRCVDAGLDRFPPLPRHTRTVDLSRNKVNEKFKCLNSFLRVQCSVVYPSVAGEGEREGGRRNLLPRKRRDRRRNGWPTLPSY